MASKKFTVLYVLSGMLACGTGFCVTGCWLDKVAPWLTVKPMGVSISSGPRDAQPSPCFDEGINLEPGRGIKD